MQEKDKNTYFASFFASTSLGKVMYKMEKSAELIFAVEKVQFKSKTKIKKLNAKKVVRFI